MWSQLHLGMYIPNGKTELYFDSIKLTACPVIVFSYTSAIPDANDFCSWIVDCTKLVAIFCQNNASIGKVDGSVPTLRLIKELHLPFSQPLANTLSMHACPASTMLKIYCSLDSKTYTICYDPVYVNLPIYYLWRTTWTYIHQFYFSCNMWHKSYIKYGRLDSWIHKKYHVGHAKKWKLIVDSSQVLSSNTCFIPQQFMNMVLVLCVWIGNFIMPNIELQTLSRLLTYLYL